jgi:hypothetical protein
MALSAVLADVQSEGTSRHLAQFAFAVDLESSDTPFKDHDTGLPAKVPVLGRDLWFDLKVTNMPEDPQLFWTIEHGTTENGDFSWESGVVILKRGVARFRIHSCP